jgi:hypothetical protein
MDESCGQYLPWKRGCESNVPGISWITVTVYSTPILYLGVQARRGNAARRFVRCSGIINQSDPPAGIAVPSHVMRDAGSDAGGAGRGGNWGIL